MLWSTPRYVTAIAVLGAASAVLATLLLGLTPVDWRAWAAMAALVALAERVQLEFRFERAAASFTLIEVAITACLLLLPPVPAVGAAVLGATLTQAVRRLGAVRMLFNAGHIATGVSLAVLLAALAPRMGPTVAGRTVIGVVLGMGGYVLVNVAAMVGLFRRLGGVEASRDIRAQVPLTAAMLIGQIATGIVFAAVVMLDGALAPLVVAPAAAVYLAGREARRNGELLARVRAERDRLTRVVDGASDGILLLDREGHVQVWNPAMERLTGRTADEVREREIQEVLDDRHRQLEDDTEHRWPAPGPGRVLPREFDARWTDTGGRLRAVHESHAPVLDERGRRTGDVVIVRDVSRQQELERLRSDFVARVSHELRTPLTPIRGFASVLLRRGESLGERDRRDALTSILERAGHLEALVEDLLLVTRLERGELDDVAQLGPTDVAEVIHRSVELVRQREPDRLVAVEVPRPSPRALADPVRLRQILDALLDNALRYTPAGTPVEVVAEADDEVRVIVTDHGPGIPTDRRDVVFEQFQRLEDPMTMRTGGVGLGLFLSRSLATAMGGTLECAEPRGGQGASFVLRLPGCADSRLDGPES